MRLGGAGDLPGAEASFREAVELAPDEPYPHYELGYTLALMGRHGDALEERRRTEELSRGFFMVETEIWISEHAVSGSLDADVVEMLRQLQGIVDAGGAESDQAAALSAEVIEAAPDCALGHFHRGKALFTRDPSAADEALRVAVAFARALPWPAGSRRPRRFNRGFWRTIPATRTPRSYLGRRSPLPSRSWEL